MESTQVQSKDNNIKFFAVVGMIVMAIGAIVSLFDVMYEPVMSALLGLTFLMIGGVCVMLAVWQYLMALDQELH